MNLTSPGMIEVTTPACPECKRTSTLTVPEAGYKRWKQGDYIQHALGVLTVDEREMLTTGTHPDCWDKMFPPDEED